MHKVFAQSLVLPGGTSISGPLSDFDTIASIINKILPYIFAFAGFGLLLMIVSSGFTFLTSAGEPKKMDQAKAKLTNGLIGFIIIFLAYWLVQIAGYVLGIEEITTIFGG